MTMRGKLKAYPGNCHGEYAQNDPRRPRAFLPSPHFDQLIASTGQPFTSTEQPLRSNEASPSTGQILSWRYYLLHGKIPPVRTCRALGRAP